MQKLCSRCLKLIRRGFPSQSKHERLFAVFHQSNSQATEISCKLNVYEETLSLQVAVYSTSSYICKRFLPKLQKRRGLRTNLRKLDEEILQDYSCKAFKGGVSGKKKVQTFGFDTLVTSASPEKRILLDN